MGGPKRGDGTSPRSCSHCRTRTSIRRFASGAIVLISCASTTLIAVIIIIVVIVIAFILKAFIIKH